MWLRAMAKYRAKGVPFPAARFQSCFVAVFLIPFGAPCSKSEGQSGASAKCCPVYPLDFAASSSSRNEIHNVNSKLIPRTVQAIATESRLESINLCELVVPGKLFFSFLGVGIGVRWGKGTKLNLWANCKTV